MTIQELDPDRFDAAFSSSGPRDRSPLSDANVTGLWREAMLVTAEVDEQAWLVAHAVSAGWTPNMLRDRIAARGLREAGPLGVFDV